MAEYSALVAVFTDPDTNAPSSLVAMVPGDTLASGVIDPRIREATVYVIDSSAGLDSTRTTVQDSSAGWGVGVDPSIYNDIAEVSAVVKDNSGLGIVTGKHRN